MFQLHSRTSEELCISFSKKLHGRTEDSAALRGRPRFAPRRSSLCKISSILTPSGNIRWYVFGATPFRRSIRMNYDAIIIGSGQAGNPLAYRLADLGRSVALVEKKLLGGTCINVGCTPTKTMVHRAQVAHYARNAARWGVNASNVSADLAKIVAQKDEVVMSFRNGQQKQIDKRPKLRLYRGHARFVAAHQLKVGEDSLESEKIFIDTGARPSIPLIVGLETVPYLTNESVMRLTTVPEHLLILGGGYIGLEFGQMFRRFGSRVTILHMGPQIVGREDPEISAEL